RLPSLYHNAKAIIFASKCENCPNILLESLAAAKPLFVSNRAPMPEFAKEGAVYFDPSNPDQLAQRMLEVIDNPKKVEELSRAAYLNSLNYSWEATGRKTFKMMQELNVGDSI
ncbi:MAG: glycosyltransferase, partial [Desulfobacteraceae bacterium]|nr:glycosyltransferase [Desulfobacteraceae bacterium]